MKLLRRKTAKKERHRLWKSSINVPFADNMNLSGTTAWTFALSVAGFDDALYEEDPDYCGGFYTISLSEARKLWNSCETLFENYPNPSKKS